MEPGLVKGRHISEGKRRIPVPTGSSPKQEGRTKGLCSGPLTPGKCFANPLQDKRDAYSICNDLYLHLTQRRSLCSAVWLLLVLFRLRPLLQLLQLSLSEDWLQSEDPWNASHGTLCPYKLDFVDLRRYPISSLRHPQTLGWVPTCLCHALHRSNVHTDILLWIK